MAEQTLTEFVEWFRNDLTYKAPEEWPGRVEWFLNKLVSRVRDLSNAHEVAKQTAEAAMTVLMQATDNMGSGEAVQLGEVLILPPAAAPERVVLSGPRQNAVMSKEDRHTIMVFADVVKKPDAEPEAGAADG